MKLLVLGGTRFLGRHFVDAALASGDEVTIFTRGRQPVPWHDVTALFGDRDRSVPPRAPAAGHDRDEPSARLLPSGGGGVGGVSEAPLVIMGRLAAAAARASTQSPWYAASELPPIGASPNGAS